MNAKSFEQLVRHSNVANEGINHVVIDNIDVGRSTDREHRKGGTMTRRAGAPALGAPWWNDIDPPGIGNNPVLVDLPEDEEPTFADYVALDGALGENHKLGDFEAERQS